MISKVDRDERTTAVEKASHSIAYIFMSFALLVDVAFRAFKTGQSSFDLIAIVVLSGLISTIYQAKHRILNKSWIKTIIFAFSIAMFVAILFVSIR